MGQLLQEKHVFPEVHGTRSVEIRGATFPAAAAAQLFIQYDDVIKSKRSRIASQE